MCRDFYVCLTIFYRLEHRRSDASLISRENSSNMASLPPIQPQNGRLCRAGMLDGHASTTRGARDEMLPLDSDALRSLNAQMASRGWARVERISTPTQLIALAKLLGTPIPTRSEKIIRITTPTSQKDARPRTLSAAFGKGAFPLHTDTAFWPTPARFVVMSVAGDLRRRTTLCQFNKIMRRLPPQQQREVATSVWRVPSVYGGFYCSLQFRAGATLGWRYDGQCMIPANRAACNVEVALQDALGQTRPEYFEWSERVTLVISNWDLLHGRDLAPENEGVRQMGRVYVR